MWPMVNWLTNLIVIFKNLMKKELAVNKNDFKIMVRLFQYIGNLLLGKAHIGKSHVR